jgi:hypothetical protein
VVKPVLPTQLWLMMLADGLTYVLAALWSSQTCPLNLSLEETKLKMLKI